MRDMYKVIKHDINRCYIPSASLQLQPLQTPQIHSIMATSFLMTTASSSINTASVLSHLPEDYIETAKGYIGSTWGDKALSSFITCTESADDYLRSSDFDDKTFETFKTRHAQLFQQVDISDGLSIGQNSINLGNMDRAWMCMDIPKVVHAYLHQEKAPLKKAIDVQSAMGWLLLIDQCSRGPEEDREKYQPKLNELDRRRLAEALVAVGARYHLEQELFLYYFGLIQQIKEKERLEEERRCKEQEQTEKKRRLDKMVLKDSEWSSGEEEENDM
jgi:hypothetical protein